MISSFEYKDHRVEARTTQGTRRGRWRGVATISRDNYGQERQETLTTDVEYSDVDAALRAIEQKVRDQIDRRRA